MTKFLAQAGLGSGVRSRSNEKKEIPIAGALDGKKMIYQQLRLDMYEKPAGDQSAGGTHDKQVDAMK